MISYIRNEGKREYLFFGFALMLVLLLSAVKIEVRAQGDAPPTSSGDSVSMPMGSDR